MDSDQHARLYDGHVHLDKQWKVESFRFDPTATGALGPFNRRLGTVGPIAEDHHLPLQIGSTDPTRALTHLRDHGVVVRWPYRSDGLHLLALSCHAQWFDDHETALDLVRAEVGGAFRKLKGQALTIADLVAAASRAANGDLVKLFEADWKADADSDQRFTHEINRALLEWLYTIQVGHRLSTMSPRVAERRFREINAVVAASAGHIGDDVRWPLARLLYIADEAALDGNVLRVVDEDDWTSLTVGGATVFLKRVNPDQDCIAPWDISTSTPMKQWARFRQRVQEAALGPVVTVPVHPRRDLFSP